MQISDFWISSIERTPSTSRSIDTKIVKFCHEIFVPIIQMCFICLCVMVIEFRIAHFSWTRKGTTVLLITFTKLPNIFYYRQFSSNHSFEVSRSSSCVCVRTHIQIEKFAWLSNSICIPNFGYMIRWNKIWTCKAWANACGVFFFFLYHNFKARLRLTQPYNADIFNRIQRRMAFI